MPSSADPAPGAAGDGRVRRRDRTGSGRRRVSRSRLVFLRTINAQITGTRVLAVLAVAVLLGGGAYWLTGTTGSPLIGAYFIALGLLLCFTVYWFIQVMRMFAGKS